MVCRSDTSHYQEHVELHGELVAAPCLAGAMRGSMYVWQDDVRHGRGVMKFADGTVYTGEFEDGRHHGKGKMTNVNGSSYDGNYQSGVPSGDGVWSSAPHTEQAECTHLSDTYSGQWENGSYHGRAVQIWYKDGEEWRYEGQYEHGTQHGYGILTYGDGSKYEGNWHMGDPEEPSKHKSADGTPYNGRYAQYSARKLSQEEVEANELDYTLSR